MSFSDPRIQSRWKVMEEGRMSLLDHISSLDSHQLRTRPPEGTWCLLELIEHLQLVDQQILEVLPRHQISARLHLVDYAKYLALLIAMEIPFKFKAPRSTTSREIPTHADLLFKKWAITRFDWFEYLEKAPVAYNSHAVFTHPRAGRMTLPQTLFWMTRHQKRHIRQALRIITQIASAP